MQDDSREQASFSVSVARALDILETLDSSRRGLNISEISRKLKIPKSTAHVIMVTLARRGYIEKPTISRRYSLGLRAYGLGQQLMKSLRIAEMALPHMEQLVAKIHLTSHLAVLDKEQAVCIQKVEPAGLIKFDTKIGRRLDLHCTALGKVLLAHMGPDFLREFLSKRAFMRHTRNTICSPGALRDEVMRVRKRGYAIHDQEQELDVRCVAVPVFDRELRFAAALSVTGTTGQLPLDALEPTAKLLQTCAAGIFRAQRTDGQNGVSPQGPKAASRDDRRSD